jgi:hypothetical protein
VQLHAGRVISLELNEQRDYRTRSSWKIKELRATKGYFDELDISLTKIMGFEWVA